MPRWSGEASSSPAWATQRDAFRPANNCHGPDGAGLPPTIPYLAGQYAQYIAQELRGWKSGARKTSPDSMAVIAKDLDDQEIAAVAAFYQQARVAAGTAVSK